MMDMITTPASSFTRPANTTAYADTDLVANSATAGEVEPLRFTTAQLSSGRGKIKRARLHKSAVATTNAKFDLHLWSAAPTPTNGDNGTLAVDKALTYLGVISFDMTTGFAGTDGLSGLAAPAADILFDLGKERQLYGLLEATAAYTPASAEVFTATLEIEG